MTIRVTKRSNTYSIKVNNANSVNNFKVSVTGEAGSVAGSLNDLEDFNPAGVQNGYIIMYDSATQKYVPVDPDEVLTKAVDGGLPSTFINELDSELDDKIDLDAGTF